MPRRFRLTTNNFNKVEYFEEGANVEAVEIQKGEGKGPALESC